MFEFLKGIRAKQVATVEEAWTKYRELINHAAKRGDLDGKNTKVMEQAMEILKLTPEAVEADIATMTEANRLTPIAAAWESHRDEHKAAGREYKAMTEAYAAKVAAIQAEIAVVKKRHGIAEVAMSASSQARESLQQLHSRHRRLFGYEPAPVNVPTEGVQVDFAAVSQTLSET
jgi:hypothetical protein